MPLHVTTTKHGPQPITLDTMLIGPRVCVWLETGAQALAQARPRALDYSICNNNLLNRNYATKTTLCRRVVALSYRPSTWAVKLLALGLFGFAFCYRKTFNVCLGFVVAATFVFAHFAHMY